MTTAPAPLHPSAPLGVGEVLSLSLGALRRRPGLFLALSAIPAAAMTVLLVVVMAIWLPLLLNAVLLTPASVVQALALPVGVVVVGSIGIGLLQLWVVGLMSILTRETLADRRPAFADLVRLSRGSFGRLVVLAVLGVVAYGVVVAVILAPMLVSVAAAVQDPGGPALAGGVLLTILLTLAAYPLLIFVMVRLVYLLPSVSLAGLAPTAALRHAWGLTRGVFWRTFGYLLVAYLIVWALSMVAGTVLQLAALAPAGQLQAGGSTGPELGAALAVLTIAAAVVQAVVQLVTVPFLVAVITVMYAERTHDPALPRPAAPTWGAVPGQPFNGGQPYGRPGTPTTGYGQPPYGQPGYPPPGYGQWQPGGQPPQNPWQPAGGNRPLA
ncbi:MAG: glycerophosphoryl diester phosphodiesterase membrane domain-containing protein [Propionicimonas sp.]|nr:glycerophosphoryl diester phosphodiesterase membrane domain-containing protein [Propionicimonas sp.]